MKSTLLLSLIPGILLLTGSSYAGDESRASRQQARPSEPDRETAGPFIEDLNPATAYPGDVVTLWGASFGTEPGENRVHLCLKTRRGIGYCYPAPVVEWQSNHILIYVPKKRTAGTYDVSIAVVYSRATRQLSNQVELQIGRSRPGPPAVGISGLTPKRENGMITSLDPELESPGQVVYLHGVFPHAGANMKVILSPMDATTARMAPPQVLTPLSGNTRKFMRVVLPSSRLIAGEYLLIPSPGESQRGIPGRIVIRSTPPAPWESGGKPK